MSSTTTSAAPVAAPFVRGFEQLLRNGDLRRPCIGAVLAIESVASCP